MATLLFCDQGCLSVRSSHDGLHYLLNSDILIGSHQKEPPLSVIFSLFPLAKKQQLPVDAEDGHEADAAGGRRDREVLAQRSRFLERNWLT